MSSKDTERDTQREEAFKKNKRIFLMVLLCNSVQILASFF